ncbi:hypothetical protein LOZ80_14440 [Paenibacillus sp. HWE-109]|uniref:putative phage abortive infection protein n=1 Tax=Paenibacillus sp. HWE-109 TaxID=1306526 RepID=UPI001EE08486|nr:putative phage abortive infection protein [Paenibacillus sp. HWE-109]UKS30063.1 hypothetical protein LOZ80_14440 [Paenibacillus sp. HWE-109]
MKKKNDIWILCVFLLIVFALWVYTWLSLKGVNQEERGIFGDMFGGANALFSGMAFAGILYTIYLQRKDLAIQHDNLVLQQEAQKTQLEDLRIQSEALKKSAFQLEKQQQLMDYQVAQETVITLISIKEKYVEGFCVPVIVPETGEEEKRYGKAALSVMYQANNRNIDPNQYDMTPENSDFKRYYDIIFYILNFIHDSNLSKNQKKILADILNIQISDSELILICKNHDRSVEKLLLLQVYGFEERHEDIFKQKKVSRSHT